MPHSKNTTEAEKRLNEYIVKFKNSFHQEDALLESLEALNEYTQFLFAKDELGGQIAFTEERQKKLLELYANAYSETDRLLAKETRIAYLPLIDNLRNLLATDMNTLLHTTPDDEKSLQEIMTSSRAMKISAEGKKLDEVGASSNKRYAMTIERNGKEVQGFFTVEKKHTPFSLAGFMPALENAAKSDAQLKTMLDDPEFHEIVKEAVEYLENQKGSFPEPEVAFPNAVQKVLQENQYASQEVQHFRSQAVNLINRLAQVSPEAVNELKSQLTEQMQYDMMLAADQGSSITGRNVAMSRVAQMLGISHVIVQSDFMKIADKEGNAQNGVFTEKAHGLERSKVLPEQIPSFNPELPPSPSAIKNIAELEVLDFICQNVDRHEDNLFYQLSEDGTRLAGIQGIDNDYSFGTADDTSVNDIKKYHIKPTAIKIIPADLNRRLEAMDDSMLELCLKDTGLSKKEIDAAVKRMNLVKEAVKNHEIQVVDDEQIKKEDFQALGENYGSLFQRIYRGIGELNQKATENAKDAEKDGPAKSINFEKVRVMTGLDKATMEIYRNQAQGYANRIHLSQAKISDAGSQQFRDLEDAVEKFTVLAGTGKIDYVQKTLQSMQEAADKYIKFKNSFTLNMRTRERIRIAKEVRAFAEDRLRAVKQAMSHSEKENQISLLHRQRDAALQNASEQLFDAYKDHFVRKGENEKAAKLEQNKEELLQIFADSKAAVKVAASPSLKPFELSNLAGNALREHAEKVKSAGKKQDVPEKKADPILPH